MRRNSSNSNLFTTDSLLTTWDAPRLLGMHLDVHDLHWGASHNARREKALRESPLLLRSLHYYYDSSIHACFATNGRDALEPAKATSKSKPDSRLCRRRRPYVFRSASAWSRSPGTQPSSSMTSTPRSPARRSIFLCVCALQQLLARLLARTSKLNSIA